MSRRCFLLVVLLPLLAGAGEMYKWVDKDGNVHFSDRPPEEETASLEELELKVDIDPQRVAEGQARLEQTENNLDQRRASQAAAEQGRREQQEEADRAVAQRQAQCHVARSNLQVLKEQRPVYEFDADGNRVFVEDQDREARIAEFQRAVNQYCR